MIAHLMGIVKRIAVNAIVLDVNGVGYSVICSSRTIREAEKCVDGLFSVLTVLNVREDAWTLFGFISELEQFWFRKFTSVQGVGGRVAIAILSALTDNDIYQAFLTEDKNIFTSADGVGSKLAGRIVVELKDKIVGKLSFGQDFLSGNFAPNPEGLHPEGIVGDVISALVNLGYQKPEIFRVLASISGNDAIESFDVLLKKVLNKLSSGRAL
ncbi:MAG: Holliday junction branch migration protein RuvA [Holosporaceae bacterium]|jgi:Holliday junction DNA helicase RuvA|nr:Holliday junction branch migration protein RuvA [Holosporaceae bacterium]